MKKGGLSLSCAGAGGDAVWFEGAVAQSAFVECGFVGDAGFFFAVYTGGFVDLDDADGGGGGMPWRGFDDVDVNVDAYRIPWTAGPHL